MRSRRATSNTFSRLAQHGSACGAGLALLCVATVGTSAQTGTGLRGAMDESELTGSLLATSPLRPQRDEQSVADEEDEPRYEPVSEGAVVDDDESAIDRSAPVVIEAPRGLGSRPQRQSGLPGRFSDEEELARGETRTGEAADTELLRREAEAELRRRQSVDARDLDRNVSARPSAERTGAIEAIEPREDDDPYAPLGIRVGTFDVTTSLETGLTVTDNVDSSPGGGEGLLSETTLRLNAVSDWARHSATIDGYYTHLESLSGANYSEPNAGIDATLTVEVGNDYQVNAAAGYGLARESAVGPSNAVSRSLRHTIDGSLGFEKSAGKLRFALTGAVQREQYTGGAVSQSDRNATLLTATLRGGYEISPALVPFVETEIGRRIHDEELDQNGFARSSNRLGLRAGAAFDFGEKLSGEVSAGWLREELDDATLDPVSGLSVNAALNWSPSRQTTLALDASTEVETTTTAGSSGSILYSGEATLTRQIRANLSAEATLGGYFRDFSGGGDYDLSYRAGLGFTYWFNRFAGLTGRASHETVTSSDPNREYSTNRVFLGLRLQR